MEKQDKPLKIQVADLRVEVAELRIELKYLKDLVNETRALAQMAVIDSRVAASLGSPLHSPHQKFTPPVIDEEDFPEDEPLDANVTKHMQGIANALFPKQSFSEPRE